MPLLPGGMLWDMDDTILTFDAVADISWDQTLHQISSALPNIDSRVLKNAIRDTARVFWSDPDRHRTGRLHLDRTRQDIVLAALSSLHVPDGHLAATIAATYGRIRDEHIRPVPGAVETLRILQKLNIPLVLVTNGESKAQREKIRRFHLEPFFTAICIEEECGVGKPDREIYERALAGLGLPPEDVWMIGDNLIWEVAAPQKLGIRGIWVDYQRRGLPEGSPVIPYKIVGTAAEIVPMMSLPHSQAQ